MEEIIIVGKMFDRDKTNGPTAVMFSMREAYARLGINCRCIVLNETMGRSKYIRGLLSIIRMKNKAINVHINGFLSALIVFLISKLNKQNTYWLTAHGIFAEQIKYYQAQGPVGIYCFIEKIVYSHFPNIICVSKLCKDKLFELYKPKGNVYVVENAIDKIDSTSVQRTNVGKSVIFLGGLQELKGWDRLVDIMKILKVEDNEIVLNIYGKSTDEAREEFQKLISDADLLDNVRFYGMLKTIDELEKAYKNSDYHISLSKFDTFNIAILEAINFGCLNITNNKSGAASLIESDRTGFLISDDCDNREVADQIVSIIKNMSTYKYNLMANQAKASIKEMTWDIVAKKYYRLFGGKR